MLHFMCCVYKHFILLCFCDLHDSLCTTTISIAKRSSSQGSWVSCQRQAATLRRWCYVSEQLRGNWPIRLRLRVMLLVPWWCWRVHQASYQGRTDYVILRHIQLSWWRLAHLLPSLSCMCSAWFLAVVCLLFWHISLRASAYCAVICLVAIQRVRAPFRKVNPMTPPWLFPSRFIVCSSAWSVATALNRLEDSRTTHPSSRRYW